jgi:hypothetical protein
VQHPEAADKGFAKGLQFLRDRGVIGGTRVYTSCSVWVLQSLTSCFLLFRLLVVPAHPPLENRINHLLSITTKASCAYQRILVMAILCCRLRCERSRCSKMMSARSSLKLPLHPEIHHHLSMVCLVFLYVASISTIFHMYR